MTISRECLTEDDLVYFRTMTEFETFKISEMARININNTKYCCACGTKEKRCKKYLKFCK